MKKTSIRLAGRPSIREVERVLVSWAGGRSERIAVRQRLRSAEGGLHWHIGGTAPGMGRVEVNVVPDKGIIEVMVHDNRRGTCAGDATEGASPPASKSLRTGRRRTAP